MRRLLLSIVVLTIVACPLIALAESKTVPEGTEKLIIEYMTNAKKEASKKVLKGPVPFTHQEHASRDLTCVDCHHKLQEGAAVQPCHECHKDKESNNVISLNDAFHGGNVKSMPSLHSCIGCHRRKVYEYRPSTDAPWQKKPCEACHSIGKD